MHLERRDDSIEYVESQEAVIAAEIDDTAYTSQTGCLKPLREIDDCTLAVDSDEIASALGYPVDTLDGSPVYHGCKQGLELYYVAPDDETQRLLVVSFGESQPGRYAYRLEAVVSETNT